VVDTAAGISRSVVNFYLASITCSWSRRRGHRA
jgi:hypothetical protein